MAFLPTSRGAPPQKNDRVVAEEKNGRAFKAHAPRVSTHRDSQQHRRTRLRQRKRHARETTTHRIDRRTVRAERVIRCRGGTCFNAGSVNADGSARSVGPESAEPVPYESLTVRDQPIPRFRLSCAALKPPGAPVGNFGSLHLRALISPAWRTRVLTATLSPSLPAMGSRRRLW